MVEEALVEGVRSRETFDAFLRAIVEDASANGMTWENPGKAQFLAALSAWLDDSAGFYRNAGLDPSEISPWRLLSDGLMEARYCE